MENNNVNKKIEELSDEQLKQVAGGNGECAPVRNCKTMSTTACECLECKDGYVLKGNSACVTRIPPIGEDNPFIQLTKKSAVPPGYGAFFMPCHNLIDGWASEFCCHIRSNADFYNDVWETIKDSYWVVIPAQMRTSTTAIIRLVSFYTSCDTRSNADFYNHEYPYQKKRSEVVIPAQMRTSTTSSRCGILSGCGL